MIKSVTATFSYKEDRLSVPPEKFIAALRTDLLGRSGQHRLVAGTEDGPMQAWVDVLDVTKDAR
jgi:hypothetical protein